jgi:hypothetical protein
MGSLVEVEMLLQLLIETAPFEVLALEERANGRLWVSGKVQQADLENLNKRKYPFKLLEREVTKLQSLLEGRGVIGELDHPQDGKTQLYRASHLWTGLSIDKSGQVLGEAELLPTPRGQVAEALFKAKVLVGASSRGQGSVNSTTGTVSEDYNLETFDFVHKPSTSGAYPKLMKEEQEMFEALAEDEQAFGKITELRKLVLEHKSTYKDLDNIDRIALGAQLMYGELICQRLLGRTETRGLANEVLTATKQLRTAVEESLGMKCAGGACELTELTASGAIGMAPPTPIVSLSPSVLPDKQTDDRGHDDMDDNLKAVQDELKKLTASVETDKEEMSRLQPFEDKYKKSLDVIEGMKQKVVELEAEVQESKDKAETGEELLGEALSRLDNLETSQSTGYRKRLALAEELIEHLVERAENDEGAEVLAAAEELGEELIHRYLEARQEAAHAQELLAATLNVVKEDRIALEIDHLVEGKKYEDEIRPLLEEMNPQTVEDVRVQYAKLNSLHKETNDPTLPLKRNLTDDKTKKRVINRQTLTEDVDSPRRRNVKFALNLAKKMSNRGS